MSDFKSSSSTLGSSGGASKGEPTAELSATATQAEDGPGDESQTELAVQTREPDSLPTVEEAADPALRLVAAEAITTVPVHQAGGPTLKDPMRLPTPSEIVEAVESQQTQPSLPTPETGDPGETTFDVTVTQLDPSDRTEPSLSGEVPLAPATRPFVPARSEPSLVDVTTLDVAPQDDRGSGPLLWGPTEEVDPAARPTVDITGKAPPASGAEDTAPVATETRTHSRSPRILPVLTLVLAVAVVVLSLLLAVRD